MKPKTICFSFAFLFLSHFVQSQQQVPADADAFYKKAMTSINAKHIKWIKQTATSNRLSMDEAGIRKLVSGYAGQNNLNNMDIEALVALVMMQVAKDNERDLKDAMEQVKKTNEEKQKMREAQEAMEKNKNAMSTQTLDSFRSLVRSGVNATQKTQTARLQTTPNVTKVNTTVTAKASVTDIKKVQDDMQAKQESLNELSEQRSLKMQMYMDRRSKTMETLSNIMKKISETQDSIIQNMK